MLQAYQNLLESPGRHTYLAARTRLLRNSRHLPSPWDLDEVSTRVADGDFEAVPPLADTLASVWLLSPRFHFLLGMAAEQLGDMEQLAYSQLEFSSCLQGILDTGTGTRKSPFVITYPTDILDVWDVRAVDTGQDPLQARRCGELDFVGAADGPEYCFRLPRRARDVRFLASQQDRQRWGKIPQPV